MWECSTAGKFEKGNELSYLRGDEQDGQDSTVISEIGTAYKGGKTSQFVDGVEF